MARFQVGDEPDVQARFEALYAEHYKRVLGYVLRRAPAAVAADVVADVFLVAWRRLERVPDEPLPWLLGVAHKILANERRGWRRRSALVEALKQDAASGGDPAMPDYEQLEAVDAAVGRLAERDRELLRLIAWDGLTTREAASVLQISHAACRVRLHRARRRVAHDLGLNAEPSSASVGVERLDAREEM